MRLRRASSAFGLAVLLFGGGALVAHPHEDAIDRTDEPTTVLRGDSDGDGRRHRVIVLRQHHDASEIQVSVEGRARSGEMTWRLEDPDGKEMFEVQVDDGTMRGGSGRISCAGKRCDGDWRLEMKTHGDVNWTLRVWGMTIVAGPGKASQSR